MEFQHPTALSNLSIAGINYKKSDASLRGLFAVNPDQYQQLVDRAPAFGISEFFVLSTCNRTEIYGFESNKGDLGRLLTSVTSGSAGMFESLAYVYYGQEAIGHLFSVAAGLDSQILGDYEIIGQIKLAAKFSKGCQTLGSTLERLINEVLQTSKKIRTTTALSGGTVSVSFAAVQYIKAHFPCQSGKKLLLIGTGKFGCNTCKNLADYLPGFEVTLVNRTYNKAKLLADTYDFNCDLFENIGNCIDEADVILVTTGADEPIIIPGHFTGISKLVIDLSVPCNVDPAIAGMAGITLVNVDELSRIKDETLQKRAAEIPRVKEIIAEHISAFMDWYQMRQHAPVLKAVKVKLLNLQSDNIFDQSVCISVSAVTGKSAEARIQKVINGMAVKMKTKNQRGCNYIEAINDFITPVSN